MDAYSPIQLLGQAAPGGGGSQLTEMMLFLGFVVFVFYLLILRPEKKKQRAREAALNQISKGDIVVTAGGIHGTVIDAKQADTVLLEIAKGVRIKINRSSISVLNPDKKEETDKGSKSGEEK